MHGVRRSQSDDSAPTPTVRAGFYHLINGQ